MSLQINRNFDLVWCILCLMGIAYFVDIVVTELRSLETKEKCETLKGELRQLNNGVYICMDKEGRVL